MHLNVTTSKPNVRIPFVQYKNQNGDALYGETGENLKPQTPNPKRLTRTSSSMPPPSRAAPSRRRPARHRALPPSSAAPPAADARRPPRQTVRAPRADAPPHRQAVTFSVTRAASASARGGASSRRPSLQRRRPVSAGDVDRVRRRATARAWSCASDGRARAAAACCRWTAAPRSSCREAGASLTGGSSRCRSQPRRRFVRAAGTAKSDPPWSLSLHCIVDSLKIEVA